MMHSVQHLHMTLQSVQCGMRCDMRCGITGGEQVSPALRCLYLDKNWRIGRIILFSSRAAMILITSCSLVNSSVNTYYLVSMSFQVLHEHQHPSATKASLDQVCNIFYQSFSIDTCSTTVPNNML